ncbi:MAG: GTPase ObgE, partial [Firmicutes bacterium]|nr:GTPase ObgE [Bacillota bacterium]
KGGNVIFAVDKDLSSLVDYNYQGHYKADAGDRGASRFCTGKNGKDLILKVPAGTLIKDFETGGILADMTDPNASVVVLEGGSGGKGNARFKTSRRRAPSFSQQGQRCVERCVVLELKLIADVGLVGFPNVGKSTLISVISKAKPKIANYHFTTLTPSLGVAKYHDNAFVVADIPGLIEGAADGQGLGTAFLRHIERVRLILHIVDVSEFEGRSAVADYKKINAELKKYSQKLSKLKQIIVLNKCDIATKEQISGFKKSVKGACVEISAIAHLGLPGLLQATFETLQTIPIPQDDTVLFAYPQRDTLGFEIVRYDDASFEIMGGMVDELARNVVLDDYDSNNFFQSKLKQAGVMAALKGQGAKNGDLVQILDIEFVYQEDDE